MRRIGTSPLELSMLVREHRVVNHSQRWRAARAARAARATRLTFLAWRRQNTLSVVCLCLSRSGFSGVFEVLEAYI